MLSGDKPTGPFWFQASLSYLGIISWLPKRHRKVRSGVQLSNRDKEVGKDMVYQVSIAALQTSPNLSILKQYPFIAYNSVGQEILAGLGRDGQVHSCSSVHLGLGEAISPT